jgi:hypothetical protein
MDAAIRSYNNSEYYVDLVKAFARGYATGVFVIPSPPPAEGVSASAPEVKPTVTKVDKNGKPVKGGGGKSDGGKTKPGGTTSGGSTGGGSTGGGTSTTPKPTPTPTPTPTPAPEPTPQLATLTGTLTEDGASFKVGADALDWRFDQGGREAKREQVAALVGQDVTVKVELVDGRKVVLELNGQPW